jgi:molecular chaperone GrpE (heat shock protein)
MQISTVGYDENSKKYRAKNIDRSLIQLFKKAGIKKKEVESELFAPFIHAILKEAELNKSSSGQTSNSVLVRKILFVF